MRLIVFAVLLLVTFQVNAQGPTEVCPVEARVRREARFEPGGLILTAFDRSGCGLDIDGASAIRSTIHSVRHELPPVPDALQ